jgi:hypothetical protein
MYENHFIILSKSFYHLILIIHSYNVAISHSARWYFGEFINFFPNNIPFPTKDCGVGGLGIDTVIVVNK